MTSKKSIDEVLLNSDTKDVFISKLMSTLVLATKNSNNLPQGQDHVYFNMFSEVSSSSKSCSLDIRNMIQTVADFAKSTPDKKTQKPLPDDLKDPIFYEYMTDIINNLLESASIDMKAAVEDHYDEVNKRNSLKMNDSNMDVVEMQSNFVVTDRDRYVCEHLDHIPKPQQKFYTDIDNSRTNPFRPRLKKKYHFVMDLILKEEIREPENNYELRNYYPHPYENELKQFVIPDWQIVDPTPQIPHENLDFLFVDTVDLLKLVINQLRVVREIAVDLEHHSIRSFQGLTCLIQISSRTKDYIIDGLALRLHLHELGEIFDDPNIVKVFHGADHDIMWLQKDFGIYVVNCFDTFIAAKELNYPALSLAHLLKFHCGKSSNKKHQLADWRQRELPLELLQYARDDTHYLLYIYDCLRKELWKKDQADGIEQVFNSSKKVCLNRYEKEPFNPLGYEKLFDDSVRNQNIPKLSELRPDQQAALAGLWNWRDKLARDLDESVTFIMTNSLLINIGLTIPQNKLKLSDCLRKSSSAFLQDKTDDILSIMSAVKASMTVGGEIMQMPKNDVKISKVDSSNTSFVSLSKSEKIRSSSNSIYTFTPAVVPLTTPSGKNSSLGGGGVDIQSPVMGAEEIFHLAGWSTPSKLQTVLSGENNAYGNPFSPFNAYAMKYKEINEENKQRFVKATSEVKHEYEEKLRTLISADINQLLASNSKDKNDKNRNNKQIINDSANNELILSASSMNDNERNHDLNAHIIDNSSDNSENDDEFEDKIPQSYEEIVEISMKNRQKNKDKKRYREGEDDIVGDDVSNNHIVSKNTSHHSDSNAQNSISNNQQSSNANTNNSKFESSIYFAHAGIKVDTGLDSTLNFAKEIGWIKDMDQYHVIKETHLKELSYHDANNDELSSEQMEGSMNPTTSVSNSSNHNKKTNDKSVRNSRDAVVNNTNNNFSTTASTSSSNKNNHNNSSNTTTNNSNNNANNNNNKSIRSNNNNNNNNTEKNTGPNRSPVSKSNNAGFDYTRYSQSNNAIGAYQSKDDMKPSATGGNNKQSKGAKGGNPYLFGTNVSKSNK